MNDVRTVLKAAFEGCGLRADPDMLERFELYHRLLTERNRMMDLSNVPDEEMPRRHYLDSILPILQYPALIGEEDSILDVGSGAGLPGIPLAILKPCQPVTLLEANGRRCDFLREVISQLGLPLAGVLEARAETAGRDMKHRERYHVTVSRAVAALPELLEYMLPLTCVGGRALCWKGRKAEEEIAVSVSAAAVLGNASLTPFPYGDGLEESVLIRAEKQSGTPEMYPRRTGIPHKRPILS